MAILTFHNIENGYLLGLNNYHPKHLRKLLKTLIGAEYEFVSLNDYVNSDSRDDLVAITFDDGYESLCYNALPILDEIKIPATVFIPLGFAGKKAGWDYTFFLGKNRHMSRKQIVELSKTRIEVASHGFSHIDLTGISARLMRLELERSKKGLEDLTGIEVKFISYPFGRFDNLVESNAMELGYRRGFSLSFFRKSRHQFTIPRFAIYATDTAFSVSCKLGHGVFNRLERIKGAVMNSYAYGTVLLNKFRPQSLPAQH